MSRIIAYSIITGLLIVGMYAGYLAFKVEDKPLEFGTVTRQAVDSATMAEYKAAQSKRKEPEPIKWNEITAMIVSLTVAFGTVGYTASQKKTNNRLDKIDETLSTVIDQKNRENIDKRLVKIEQDAAGFVDDDNVKAFIEGIGNRTRSLCRDIMEMDFTEECLEKAILKIDARSHDCKHQVKDLGFSDYFERRVNEIRCAQTKQLKLDLTRLVADKLHNSKYERQGEMICRFEKHFMKEIIKLSHER